MLNNRGQKICAVCSANELDEYRLKNGIEFCLDCEQRSAGMIEAYAELQRVKGSLDKIAGHYYHNGTPTNEIMQAINALHLVLKQTEQSALYKVAMSTRYAVNYNF